MRWQGVSAIVLAAVMGSLSRPSAATEGVSGLELVTATSAYDSTPAKAVTAICPTGKVPVGGGASISGQPAQATIALYQSYIFGDPPNGWRGLAVNLESNGTLWEMVAKAWCAHPPPGYTVEYEATALDDSASKIVEVVCPMPLVSLAGGFRLSGSIDPKRVVAIRATTPESWFIKAKEFDGSSGDWQLTGAAVCAEDPGVQIFSVNSRAGNLDSLQYLWFQSRCPNDSIALSGGIAHDGDDAGITSSYPVPDANGNPFNGNWSARMYRFFGPSGGNLSVTHYLLCLSAEIFANGFESGDTAAWD